jgi:hypothetical protein
MAASGKTITQRIALTGGADVKAQRTTVNYSCASWS